MAAKKRKKRSSRSSRPSSRRSSRGSRRKGNAIRPSNVPDRHQLRVLIDTVKNPLKGAFLGGPSAEEAEQILRDKFRYTSAEIQRLKHA